MPVVTIEIEEFVFNVSELDGCKLIETVFPPDIDRVKLAIPAATFLSLWDETTPTVLLADVTQLRALGDKSRDVLVHILKRNETRPNLRGAVFVATDNREMFREMQRLMPEVGRLPETVFEERDAAVAYLRERIRASGG